MRNEQTQSLHNCPACGREFTAILDYPRVRVLLFERLPTPEAVDDMSAAAAQKVTAWRRTHPSDNASSSHGGINMTPEIERACRTKEVKNYLTQLTEFVGCEVNPRELLPSIPADQFFKKVGGSADTVQRSKSGLGWRTDADATRPDSPSDL
jgi:hypothetical protein